MFITLLSIFIGALLLRVYNISELEPYIDEYHHLIAAKNIIVYDNLANYSRAFIVTQIVTTFFEFMNPENFSDYLWWGRFPGALISSLTIIPLYILGKRIHPYVGLLSSVLWAISPWAIGMARVVREYAYYPFIILWVLIVFIWIYNQVLELRIKDHLHFTLGIFGILFFVIYSYDIDNLSTLKVGIFILFIAFVYLTGIHYKNIKNLIKKNKIYFLALLSTLILTFIVGIRYILINEQLSFIPSSPSLIWIEYIFSTYNTAPVQWWTNSIFNQFTVFILLFAGWVYGTITHNKYYFLIFSIAFSLLVFYILFFDRYPRPRYIFYIMPFLTILVSTSIYALYKSSCYFRPQKYKYWGYGIITMFLILSFPFSNIIHPLTHNSYSFNPITGEYHYQVIPALRFLQKNATSKDYYITTVMKGPLYLDMDITQRTMHYHYHRDLNRYRTLKNIVDKKSQGWIVLDLLANQEWRKQLSHSKDTFMIRGKLISLEYQDSQFYIYRWKEEK